MQLWFSDGGIQVDHTTLFRWIQAYAPELDKRIRPHLRLTNGSLAGRRNIYPSQGEVGVSLPRRRCRGQTIDFLLSPKRNAAAARRFFQKALKQPHTVNPRTITVDKNAAYPIATKAMKRARTLWRFAKLRQVKILNNIVEQDHRRIKRLVRPRLGFNSFTSAARTIAGYEATAMIRKGQVVSAPAKALLR